MFKHFPSFWVIGKFTFWLERAADDEKNEMKNKVVFMAFIFILG